MEYKTTCFFTSAPAPFLQRTPNGQKERAAIGLNILLCHKRLNRPAIFIILIILLANVTLGWASEIKSSFNSSDLKDTLIIATSQLHVFTDSSSTTKKTPKTTSPKKKRLVSALFAFPFPFGFMGAHRIMLGTKPWVPVVYVATFGGCFGLLPLIDFCVILFSKDFEQYENNPNLFMWVK